MTQHRKNLLGLILLIIWWWLTAAGCSESAQAAVEPEEATLPAAAVDMAQGPIATTEPPGTPREAVG